MEALNYTFNTPEFILKIISHYTKISEKGSFGSRMGSKKSFVLLPGRDHAAFQKIYDPGQGKKLQKTNKASKKTFFTGNSAKCLKIRPEHHSLPPGFMNLSNKDLLNIILHGHEEVLL